MTKQSRFASVWDAIERPKDAASLKARAEVAIVLNETGLRPDECHRLEWSDIDLRHNRLLVRHGKTKAARRSIPLTVASSLIGSLRAGPASSAANSRRGSHECSSTAASSLT